jgi:hypothetical protein
MKIVSIFILAVYAVHAAQAAPRLRRGLNVESLEIEMQLESDAEKTAQIHTALGHDDEAVDRSTELDEVLATGNYPKPSDHKGKTSKTTEELISQYLEAEPSDQPLVGQSFLSKGGKKDLSNSLEQPTTRGVQGGKTMAETNNDKKKKDATDDDEEVGKQHDEPDAGAKNDTSSFIAPTSAPSSISESPTSEGTGTILQSLQGLIRPTDQSVFHLQVQCSLLKVTNQPRPRLWPYHFPTRLFSTCDHHWKLRLIRICHVLPSSPIRCSWKCIRTFSLRSTRPVSFRLTLPPSRNLEKIL